MALHLSVDGEGADWVTKPKGDIKKANLTFTVKFLWLIVRHYLSPTAADNIVTWDRAILMAAMIVGFEVDFCVASIGGHAGEGFQGHNYLAFSVHNIFLLQVCPSGTLISSRLHWALLILTLLGMRTMSWLHEEGPVQSCLHLVKI